VGSGLNGRSAADVDQREALEEMAIVKRLRRFGFNENSHADSQALDMPWIHFGPENGKGISKRLKIKERGSLIFLAHEFRRAFRKQKACRLLSRVTTRPQSFAATVGR
jgi:hypothetical protein